MMDRTRSVSYLVVVLVCVLTVHSVSARPQMSGAMEKRVSDQRLAELETLLALAVNNRRMAESPVGFGLIDPHAIGRRKRSLYPLSDALVKELSRNPSSYTKYLNLVNSAVRQQQEASQNGFGEGTDLM